MFKLIGALVLLCVGYSLCAGRTFAKRGTWGREPRRNEHPVGCWGTIVVYALLAVALFTVF